MNVGPIERSENADVAIKTMTNGCWVYRTIGRYRCGGTSSSFSYSCDVEGRICYFTRIAEDPRKTPRKTLGPHETTRPEDAGAS